MGARINGKRGLMKKQSKILWACALLLAFSCSKHADDNIYRPKWLSTGVLVRTKVEYVVVNPKYSALQFNYETDKALSDVDGLRQEAEYIFLDFVHDIETKQFEDAVISANKEKPKGFFAGDAPSYAFIFKKIYGKWSSPDARLNEFLSAMQERDLKAKKIVLKSLADSGDTAAAGSLAGLYVMEKDNNKAAAIFEKLAAQGNPSAMTALSGIYSKNSALKKKATELLLKAADMGFGQAQYELGIKCLTASDSPVDPSRAMDYLESAYDNGVADAGVTLGAMYMTGTGVPKDSDKAFKYTREAADLGLSEAQSNLAYLYLLGEGVRKNCDEAFKWAKKASDQGNATGIDNLGNVYEEGCGVKKDLEKALSLYRLSAEKGNQFGKADLERLSRSLPAHSK